MAQEFNGKEIRDEIIDDLRRRAEDLPKKPVLAVVWIGDDFASARYIEAKQRAAEQIGIHFDLIKYSDNVSLEIVKKRILELNSDPNVTGLMIQLPIPKHFDLIDLVNIISPQKDVDALRFCSNLHCDFQPPVAKSVLLAIKQSGVLLEQSIVTIIGKGFLVGTPMAHILEGQAKELRVADINTPYLATLTVDADIVISATGVASLIRPKMIKPKAVLIDAGTTELGGKLAGDIDPSCYAKAAFYTPVPGGIGPVTVAMLLSNVLSAAEQQAGGAVE